MLLVHQNLDFEISLGQPNGAHDLEASKVRTEEDTSLAASQLIREYLESSYFDVKLVTKSGEKVDSVEMYRCKAMILPIQVTPADRTSQGPNQIGPQGTTCLPQPYEVIAADRIKQGTRERTPNG
jgi:hypothetical protein